MVVKLHILLKFIIISAMMTGLFLSFTGCGGGTQTVLGGGTQTVGVLVDDKNQFAVNADVKVYQADAKSAYDSVRTDSNGKYKIDSLPVGSYTIVCRATDGLMAYIGPFSLETDSSKIDLETDTVYRPGNIEGCINYPAVANVNHDAVVYIPGTSYSAWVNDSEPFTFTLSGIPRGTFTLKFSGTGFTKKISDVTVESDLTYSFDECLTLDIDTVGNPPAPVADSIVIDDESAGSVIVTWNSVEVADISRYEVSCFSSLSSTAILDTTSDTWFTDTIFHNRLTDTIPCIVTYQIKSIDMNNNLSNAYSEKLSLFVYPPSYYRTKFSWSIKSKSGSDTVTNKDTAIIKVTLTNRKRPPEECMFITDNINDVYISHYLSATELPDSSFIAIDSFTYKFESAGKHTIAATCIDSISLTHDTLTLDVFDYNMLYPHDLWKTLDSLSDARYYTSAVAVDSIIYVIGGAKSFNGKNISLSKVERYNCKTLQKLSDGVRLPEPLYSFGAAVSAKNIFIFGGVKSDTIMTSIWSLGEGGAEWIKSSALLPRGLQSMAVCCYNSSIFIFGGSNNGMNVTDEILQFDPAAGTIKKVAKLITPRAYHQAVIVNDKIYIMGGMTDEGMELDNVEVFNPSDYSLKSAMPLKKTRMIFSAGVIDNKIYISGGLSSTTDIYGYADVECYNTINPADGFVKTNLDRKLYGDAAAVSAGRFFSFGGTTNNCVNSFKRAFVYYP